MGLNISKGVVFLASIIIIEQYYCNDKTYNYIFITVTIYESKHVHVHAVIILSTQPIRLQ